jgi:ubiquinone/menaquinone biosynthesis C-methylase UbiE
MDVRQAYNIWADLYDNNTNKTRDLEAISLRETLEDISVEKCLEIGCGTGKNTEWLVSNVKELTAIDISEEMLIKAKEKINSDKVQFIQVDITKEWTFSNGQYDLVIFSLVLEHIEDLYDIFQKVNTVTGVGSYVYIGELHPFKQYTGTKARFDTDDGQQIVTCFNHNISDFTHSAKMNGFEILEIKEYFDYDDKTSIPRILTLLLTRQV